MKQLQDAVFITGAGQRIGYYLANAFLQQGDYPVLFTYRTHHPEVDALKALGGIGFQVDFTSPDALPALIKQVKASAGSLRAIIHNASIWLPDDAMTGEEGGVENFNALFQVHVEVPYVLNKAFTPLLQASSAPLKDIVSLSDASVNRVSADHIAYVASKAALQAVSKGFAKKLAPNIKVNDIAPALILFNKGDDEEYKQQRLAQSALGIEPGPEVVWQAVQYLMNSPYTTGTVLALDGGKK
ncbi:MAG: dihydromonapterin reductase [Thiomicrorhabdus sp.]|nr:dihydromonapterin reductase [Thiomicrorhabdus sp.]